MFSSVWNPAVFWLPGDGRQIRLWQISNRTCCCSPAQRNSSSPGSTHQRHLSTWCVNTRAFLNVMRQVSVAMSLADVCTPRQLEADWDVWGWGLCLEGSWGQSWADSSGACASLRLRSGPLMGTSACFSLWWTHRRCLRRQHSWFVYGVICKEFGKDVNVSERMCSSDFWSLFETHVSVWLLCCCFLAGENINKADWGIICLDATRCHTQPLCFCVDVSVNAEHRHLFPLHRLFLLHGLKEERRRNERRDDETRGDMRRRGRKRREARHGKKISNEKRRGGTRKEEARERKGRERTNEEEQEEEGVRNKESDRDTKKGEDRVNEERRKKKRGGVTGRG